MSKSLYCTTIKIWTSFDPSHMEINDLAQRAMDADAYCSLQEVEHVTDPTRFPETSFFGEWDCDEEVAQ